MAPIYNIDNHVFAEPSSESGLTIRSGSLIEKIKNLTEAPQFGFLGEERINVLNLNIELDKIAESIQTK